jgi:hypothetical protein
MCSRIRRSSANKKNLLSRAIGDAATTLLLLGTSPDVRSRHPRLAERARTDGARLSDVAWNGGVHR